MDSFGSDVRVVITATAGAVLHVELGVCKPNEMSYDDLNKIIGPVRADMMAAAYGELKCKHVYEECRTRVGRAKLFLRLFRAAVDRIEKSIENEVD